MIWTEALNGVSVADGAARFDRPSNLTLPAESCPIDRTLARYRTFRNGHYTFKKIFFLYRIHTGMKQ